MANKKTDKKEDKTNTTSKESSEPSASISSTLKKIISSGSASDIPKEILGNVVSQVTKTKDEITLRVTNEFLSLVKKIDFVKEFSKFAREHKFKITAEIEVSKKDVSLSKDNSQSESQ